jgi:hypothetical protein
VIPLYPDEDSVRRSLIRGLRANRIDVISTAELGRLGADDEDQLRFAASQGRAIYTANLADFYRPAARCVLKPGRHHAGMVVLAEQRTPVGAQIRALTALARAYSPATMRDRLEFLIKWL